MDFVRACSTEDVSKGGTLAVEMAGVAIAVVHGADDAYYAIYDQCSHQEIPLSEGEVDGHTVECWLHGSRFDLRTGEPTGLPATEPVPVYPVEVRDGDVYISPEPSNGVSA